MKKKKLQNKSILAAYVIFLVLFLLLLTMIAFFWKNDVLLNEKITTLEDELDQKAYQEYKDQLKWEQLSSNIMEDYEKSKKLAKSTEECINTLANASTSFEELDERVIKVTGSVVYPSDGIPNNLQACTFEIFKKSKQCVPITKSEEGYTYQLNVSPGSYYVFLLKADERLIGLGSGSMKSKDQSTRIILDEQGNELGKTPLVFDLNEISKEYRIDLASTWHGVGSEDLYCKELY